MNITDILKEVPLSAVLRERVELEQAKAEFEVSKATARAEAAEARCIDLTAALDNEKQQHQLTRQKLTEALEEIGRRTAQPKASPKITVDIPKFRSIT